MIPIRVYVENFMSYRQGQELLFDSAPLWVLAGENGAGKSTIFDAITFALYNFHRGGKTNHKDLINHQEDSLAVEFDFLIDDLQYRIRRTVSRRGAATRQISEIIDSRIKPISNTDNDNGFKEWVEHHIGLKENAFTSCILLSQGNSDKLLTAKPTERFTILKQIIDLSAYERLHEQADNLRKQSEGEYKALARQLEDIAVVTPEQIQIAQQELNRAKQNYKLIQERVENLNQIIQQAKQWEHLQKQIEQEQKKQQDLQQLLERSEEITNNFNCVEELKLVIPKIDSIIKTKERLSKTKLELDKIEKTLFELQHNLAQAETEQEESHQECDRLQKSIEDLQTNLQQVSINLSEITPLITKLERYEQIESDLEKCDKNIAQYPTNLEQQVKQKKEQYQQLVEIKNTLPWLKSMAESRSNLSNAIAQQKAANINLISLKSQLIEARQQEETININFKQLEQAERYLSDKLNIEQANYQTVQKQLQSFEQAANKPTCELCGQEITPEHVQQEKQRLNRKLVNLDASVKNIEQECSIAKRSLSEARTKLETINNVIKDTEQNINQNKNKQQQAQQDIQKLLEQLDKDWENLSNSDRAKISFTKPNKEFEWIETTYPKNLDLEQLEQQVNTIESQKQNLDNLQQQLENWNKLDNQRQIYREQLEESGASFSISEAQRAKEEYQQFDRTQQEITNSIGNTKQELQEAKENKVIIDNKVNSCIERSQQKNQSLTENKTIYRETETNLQAKFVELPQQWQEKADNFNNDELQNLQNQSDRLIEYQEPKKQLDNAQQALDYSTQQITNYQNYIAQLPIEARCQSQEKVTELTKIKEERENSDRVKSNAEKELNKFKDMQARYAQIEQDKLQAERNNSLYKTLSNLLGKKGIQLHILRSAEKAIIVIANEILDSLSRGSIRLELREENEGTDKALDLVAYNFATGEKPTAVALTSGSQRFRIAVSLALAIGQYVGNNTRNIESVIIDEGFGSLDKNGRDDMIEELNELKQRLKRIILVSHQEEFFNEFNNGYKVELIEGASQVSLLEFDF